MPRVPETSAKSLPRTSLKSDTLIDLHCRRSDPMRTPEKSVPPRKVHIAQRTHQGPQLETRAQEALMTKTQPDPVADLQPKKLEAVICASCKQQRRRKPPDFLATLSSKLFRRLFRQTER